MDGQQLIVLGFNDTFWVILSHLQEKGRQETKEIVEEMKERDNEERGIGIKAKNVRK